MKPTLLFYLESRMRPLLIHMLPPERAVKIYSKTRASFLHLLEWEEPDGYTPPENLTRILWGVKFRSPIMNAAGMFKNGECYRLAARQGAGGYIGGTTTCNPRRGNEKDGIYLPFVPYPASGAASNWLGLPNEGDEAVSRNVGEIEKADGCPLGMSIAASPDLSEIDGLKCLVKGARLYERAGADFLEINESCPNTQEGKSDAGELTIGLNT